MLELSQNQLGKDKILIYLSGDSQQRSHRGGGGGGTANWQQSMHRSNRMVAGHSE